MSGQLAQQAQEILGKSAWYPHRAGRRCGLLIGQMVKRGFVEGLDRPLPRHWSHGGQLGLDGGDVAGLYSHEGDHRKVAVAVTSRACNTP